MSYKFDTQLYILKGEADLVNNHRQITVYPDYCPICNHGIHTNYFLIYYKNESVIELLCGCPIDACSALFFVEYKDYNFHYLDRPDDFQISNYFPQTPKVVSFPAEIKATFPKFINIYSQAFQAEKDGLDLICGVGYRKSVEYLIKDYAISLIGEGMNAEDLEREKQKINSMLLQQCITNYINHAVIKDIAKRAVWLGNDETHVVRKWKDKDLQDLKKLIDLTVHYISMEILANKYNSEMS